AFSSSSSPSSPSGSGALPSMMPSAGQSTPSSGVNGAVVQPVGAAPTGTGGYLGVGYEEEPDSKRQPLLIAGFLLVMLLIIGASGTIGYLVINRNDDDVEAPAVVADNKPADVASGDAQTQETHASSKFRHSRNSRTVYISTK